MQLGLSFSVLLASLSIAIFSSNVEALPAKRNAGMVTLPLKRLHQPRSDIHPQVVSSTLVHGEELIVYDICTALATAHKPRSPTFGSYDWPP
jgi:hypothetical protein